MFSDYHLHQKEVLGGCHRLRRLHHDQHQEQRPLPLHRYESCTGNWVFKTHNQNLSYFGVQFSKFCFKVKLLNLNNSKFVFFKAWDYLMWCDPSNYGGVRCKMPSKIVQVIFKSHVVPFKVHYTLLLVCKNW